eukprot:TRINITY_DN2286_c0_g1_i1.p2 TRINITY_DN2286_c0_g1~~TRINITY_DN2286_c0_g1_i1.p2  ORF type:complete len:484 (+),score=149.58 TRINITY_DN2286_c0_g1_i1:3313-4764(+)
MLGDILKSAKKRDVLPVDLSERMEGRRAVVDRWGSTMPNPEANGLRCAFLEAEAVRKLIAIIEEAEKVMVDLRLCAVELCPEPGKEGTYPISTPVSVSLTPSEMSLETDAIEDMVIAALRPSDSFCPDKAEDHTTSFMSDKAAGTLARWIAREWRNKDGTILTELLDNLESPVADKLSIVAKTSKVLQARAPELAKDYCAIELFVMALYTMAGHDIDALMGYPKVPTDPTAPSWAKYKPRNEAMFRVVNSAMRAAGNSPVSSREWPWVDIKKWVKTIVMLTALSGKNGKFDLSRGLAGLPESIVLEHAKLRNGNVIYWSAPSSCALDPTVSKAYINGAAANATQQVGGKLLFELRSTCGLPLQKISKYPKEAEVLLPPLTELAVHTVKDVDGVLTVQACGRCRMKEHLHGVCLDSHAEALRASKSLEDCSPLRKRQPAKSTSQSPRRILPIANNSGLLMPTRAWEGKVVLPSDHSDPPPSRNY